MGQRSVKEKSQVGSVEENTTRRLRKKQRNNNYEFENLHNSWPQGFHLIGLKDSKQFVTPRAHNRLGGILVILFIRTKPIVNKVIEERRSFTFQLNPGHVPILKWISHNFDSNHFDQAKLKLVGIKSDLHHQTVVYLALIFMNTLCKIVKQELRKLKSWYSIVCSLNWLLFLIPIEDHVNQRERNLPKNVGLEYWQGHDSSLFSMDSIRSKGVQNKLSVIRYCLNHDRLSSWLH